MCLNNITILALTMFTYLRDLKNQSKKKILLKNIAQLSIALFF